MLMGWNAPRPTEENYCDFMEKLTSGLLPHGERGLSLMVYGSWVRRDYNPGRSDIDGVWIFPGGPVIDKAWLRETGRIVACALEGNPVPFQVTVSDLETMKDGRFNSYNPSFEHYFNEEGKVIVGPDYRSQFRFELPDQPDLQELKFNLRKARQGLLFAEHDCAEDYESFLRKFTKSLDAVSRGSKQVLYLLDDVLRKNRFSVLEEIENTFPEIDTEPLGRIRRLYHEPLALDALFNESEEVIDLWENSVTFLEGMLGAYLSRRPRNYSLQALE